MPRYKTQAAHGCLAMEAAATSGQIERIEAKLDELLSLLRNPVEVRTAYTIDEVSELIKISKNTIRIWCRHGRINASRRAEKSGGAEVWSITAKEVTRYRDEGLLPLDPDRNAR